MADKMGRVGETHTNKDGDTFKIVEYLSYRDLVVQFLDSGSKYNTSYDKVVNKVVRDVDKYYIPTVDHSFDPALSFEDNISLLYEMFSGRTANQAWDATEQFCKDLVDYHKSANTPLMFWKFVELTCDSRTENKYTGVFKKLASKFKPTLNYVYLLMQEGSVVYVGKSTRIITRLNDHRKEGCKVFDSVMVKEVDAEIEMDVLENSLIYKLKPIYNKSMIVDFVKDEVSTEGFVKLKEYLPLVIYEKTKMPEFRFNIENYLDYDGFFIRKDMVNSVTNEKLGWRKADYVKPRKGISWEIIGHRD
jgi:hypothetical protein